MSATLSSGGKVSPFANRSAKPPRAWYRLILLVQGQRPVPLLAIFGIFSIVAVLSVGLVLLIRPQQATTGPAPLAH